MVVDFTLFEYFFYFIQNIASEMGVLTFMSLLPATRTV